LIERDLGVAWRSVFTAMSFLFFGTGALMLGALVLPVIHISHPDRRRAQRASRAAVRRSFRLFIWFMRASGVLDYRVRGPLDVPAGTLIVANHPSLIDVIFIVAHLPDALCVVKEELRTNPFTRLIVRATGYLGATRADRLIEACAERLTAGERVIMFPEGTRSVPGRRLTFRRGAANVLCRAPFPVTPVFLRIEPPTLAKGESWLRAPAEKVRYTMEIGTALQPGELFDSTATDRQNARTCTERLERLFEDHLARRAADRTGANDTDGKSAEGHQSPDREYSRT
jgi:1-acyl-sn-glycerol-3-phosphate acyltransferase